MSQLALARFENQRLRIENSGTTVDLPNDNVARLMYYLHCISCLLDDCVPANLTNYRLYRSLTQRERLMVIGLALELTPDKVPLFIPVSRLPEDKSNMFLKFSSLSETLTALGIQSGGAAMMALQRQVGSSQKLIEVMAYTQGWLNRNYLNPLMEIRSEMQREQATARRNSSSGCTLL
ncbi:hypothetical protein BOX15_Mlig013201g1 [Macrostomum lignano]|uniref:Uncharacterized protein n=1 Tax=Macrostomum lignano TaxID=282301 RepID=A0A267ER32_9PLAT|nr:hypothetical protein BOX15_Mlig013201g1 [Macrostomum lignano]